LYHRIRQRCAARFMARRKLDSRTIKRTTDGRIYKERYYIIMFAHHDE
jgi:hypothetical protein